jgi:hypothetical protein
MGQIINGRYYKEDAPKQLSKDSGTYKGWNHAEQRKNHARELIQPYKNGKPNLDFIAAFPEESREYGFTPKDEDLKGL